MENVESLKRELVSRYQDLFPQKYPPVMPACATILPEHETYVADILRGIADEGIDIICLNGPIGTGKTTAAYQALRRVSVGDTDVNVVRGPPRESRLHDEEQVFYMDLHDEQTRDPRTVTRKWIRETVGHDSRTLIIECRDSSWSQIQLHTNRIPEVNIIDRYIKVDFSQAVSRDVVKKVAETTLDRRPAGTVLPDVVANTVDSVGNMPALAIYAAYEISPSDVPKDEPGPAVVDDFLPGSDNSNVRQLMELVAFIGEIDETALRDIWPDSVDQLEDGIDNVGPYLQTDPRYTIPSFLRSGIVYRALRDGRGRELARTFANNTTSRRRADAIVRQVTNVFSTAQSFNVTEVADSAVEFANSFLAESAKSAESEHDWAAITRAVDGYVSGRIPVQLGLFSAHSEKMMLGYRAIADNAGGAPTDSIEAEQLATLNIARSTAGWGSRDENTVEHEITYIEAIESILDTDVAEDDTTDRVNIYRNLFSEIISNTIAFEPDFFDGSSAKNSPDIVSKFCDHLEDEADIEITDKTGYQNNLWAYATVKIISKYRFGHPGNDQSELLHFVGSNVLDNLKNSSDEKKQKMLREYHEVVSSEVEDIAANQSEQEEILELIREQFVSAGEKQEIDIDHPFGRAS